MEADYSPLIGRSSSRDWRSVGYGSSSEDLSTAASTRRLSSPGPSPSPPKSQSRLASLFASVLPGPHKRRSRQREHSHGPEHSHAWYRVFDIELLWSADIAREEHGEERLSMRVVDLSRTQLLDAVAHAATEPPLEGSSDTSGGAQRPLTGADLRALVPQHDAFRKAAIVVRGGCLLLSLPPLRALLFRRRLLLLGDDASVEPVAARLRPWSRGDDDGDSSVLASDPFEQAALAAVLAGAVAAQEVRVRGMAARMRHSVSKRLLTEVQLERHRDCETECHLIAGDLEGIARCVDAATDEAAAAFREGGAGGLSAATGIAASRGSSSTRLALFSHHQHHPVSLSALHNRRGGGGGGGGSFARAASAGPPVSLSRLRATAAPLPLDTGLSNETTAGGLAGALAACGDRLDGFGEEVGDLLLEALALRARLELDRKRITVSLAKHRNRIMRVGVALQLALAVLALCQVVAAYFGMNLGNGICGPEGCLEQFAADQGYAQFKAIVGGSVGGSVALGLLTYSAIRWYL